MADIIMAYIVMAGVGTAYIVMAYMRMACAAVVYIGMPYIVMAYVVMAYTVMAYMRLWQVRKRIPYMVMADSHGLYVVMADKKKRGPLVQGRALACLPLAGADVDHDELGAAVL